MNIYVAQNLLFLDTETTGNEPGRDRLVSLAYKLGDQLTHEMFRPPREISLDAMSTHHITNEMVAKKRPFLNSPLKNDLTQLLENHILVAHNAAFDISMLESEGLKVPHFICTVKVSRALDTAGTVPRFGLQFLRYYHKLNLSGVPAHDAEGDVLVLEALFKKLLPNMVKNTGSEEQAIAAMVEISKQPSLINQFSFGKHKGKTLSEIARTDPGYLEWLLREKKKAAATGAAWSGDEDLVYSLERALTQKAA